MNIKHKLIQVGGLFLITGFLIFVPSARAAIGVPIVVKDTSVANNLITDTQGISCGYGQWCTWSLNSTSSSVVKSDGSIAVQSSATTGPYSSCWIQWVDGAKADGSYYRLAATFASNFPSNTSFFQIQTTGKENYLSPPLYTTGRTSLNWEGQIIDSNTSFVSVKFCSWGTNNPANAAAALSKISFEKIEEPWVNTNYNTTTAWGQVREVNQAGTFVGSEFWRKDTAVCPSSSYPVSSTMNVSTGTDYFLDKCSLSQQRPYFKKTITLSAGYTYTLKGIPSGYECAGWEHRLSRLTDNGGATFTRSTGTGCTTQSQLMDVLLPASGYENSHYFIFKIRKIPTVNVKDTAVAENVITNTLGTGATAANAWTNSDPTNAEVTTDGSLLAKNGGYWIFTPPPQTGSHKLRAQITLGANASGKMIVYGANFNKSVVFDTGPTAQIAGWTMDVLDSNFYIKFLSVSGEVTLNKISLEKVVPPTSGIWTYDLTCNNGTYSYEASTNSQFTGTNCFDISINGSAIHTGCGWTGSKGGTGETDPPRSGAFYKVGNSYAMRGRIWDSTKTTLLVDETITKTCGVSPQCTMRPKGDATCNDIVNGDDFACWIKGYKKQTLPSTCKNVDYNDDKKVSILDHALWHATMQE